MIDEFFDLIGLGFVGDEDAIGGVDDDEILDSEEGDVGVFPVFRRGGVDGVAGGILGADGGIMVVSLGVFGEVFSDGDPGSYIVPIEGGFDVEDAGGALHEGVVDADGGELGELAGEGGGDVGGGANFVDEIGELGAVAAELCDDGGDAPDEHAGVPGEVARFEEFFGELGIWLFAKAHDFVGGDFFGKVGGGAAFAALNVAVAGAGPGGLDADGDEGAGGGGEFGGAGHDAAVFCGVGDELIGGEDDHGGFGISGGDPADAEGYGGGGVALGGFGEDIFCGEIGEGGADGVFLGGVGEDEDVFPWDEAFEAIDGLCEEGAIAEEVEQLLRRGVAREGPEAGAGAAGEDEGVCH